MAAGCSFNAADARGFTLAAYFAVVPGVAIFAPLAIVPLTAVAGFLCLLANFSDRRWPRKGLWLVFAAGLTAWALLSSLWAVDRVVALRGGAGLGLLVLVCVALFDTAAALSEDLRRMVGTGLVTGIAVAAVLLLSELVGGGALSAYLHSFDESLEPGLGLRSLNRGAAILAVVLPLAVHHAVVRWSSWTARLVLALSVAGIAVILWVMDKNTMRLALIAGIVAGLAAVVARRMVAIGMMLMLVAIVVSAPFLARSLDPQEIWNKSLSIPWSLHHRLTVWKFTADRIAEKPLAGWGMNAAKHIPGGDQDVTFVRVPQRDMGDVMTWRLMPLHPHNNPLQWWLELGGVGAVLCTAIVLLILRRIMIETSAALATYEAASFAIAMTFACSSFGAWQSWWLCTLILAAAAAISQRPVGNGVASS